MLRLRRFLKGKDGGKKSKSAKQCDNDTNHVQPCSLTSLPVEILLEIFSYLTWEDRWALKVGTGSRYIRDALRSCLPPFSEFMAAQLSGLRTEKDVFAEAARIGYDTLLLTMFQKNTLGDVKTHGMSLLWPHGTDLDYERAGRTVVIDAGLQAASGAGRLSTVKLLLGEDVRPDHDILFSLLVGLTPLTAAVRNGQKDAAKLLLKHMTKRQRKLQLRHSLDAVIETASLPMVELLVDLGVRVPDEDGETPILRRAVKNGNAEIFALLMKRGAVDETAHPDLQIQDSAVELAAAAGYAATVRLLLGKRRSTVTPRNEQIKALQLAAGNGKDEVVKLFLDHGISDLDDDRLTGWNLSIYTAARAGHATTVDILLQHCRNTDKKKYFFPHTMAFAIETGNVELVQMLLEIGLSVDDILQPFGYTPLQRALVFDRPEVISFLLGLGADSNMEVSKTTAEKSYVVLPAGSRPIHIAARESKTSLAITCLVNYGADPSAQDKKGRTALHHAAIRGKSEIVSALLSSGCDVNVKDATGSTALDFAHDKTCRELILARVPRPFDKNGK